MFSLWNPDVPMHLFMPNAAFYPERVGCCFRSPEGDPPPGSGLYCVILDVAGARAHLNKTRLRGSLNIYPKYLKHASRHDHPVL